jgi:hypothetical protein
MLFATVLCTNFAKGQNYYLYDPSIPGGAFNSFLKTSPFPSTIATSSWLEVGTHYAFKPTRGIFFGGNLGVTSDINQYGNYLGKWSFTGTWKLGLTSLYAVPHTYAPGINYLVNYHRWGDYAAHFGLRAVSTYIDPGTPYIETDADQKDAVITWSYEHSKTPNRLIFQTIKGVDDSGSINNNVEYEWATILSNGNIGSGTSTPTAQFQIKPLSSSGIPLMEMLDAFNNPKFTFTKGGKLGLGVSSPAEVLDVAGNLKLVGDYTQTGNASVTGATFLDGHLTIRGNTSAGWMPLTITDNVGTPGSNLFIVDNLGDVTISDGQLFIPTIAGAGIPTTTLYNNILAINSLGQVISGPAPSSNTLWEMGGNSLSTTGILGSKSDYDVDFKVGTSLTLAYKVHGANSTYRGYTEFNKPVSINTTANANWTLNLKSVGTTAGTQGVLNCESTAGASIFKIDNAGNMYLPSPSMSPGAGNYALLAIDGNNGQILPAAMVNSFWSNAGNTYSGSGAAYSFGTTSNAGGTIYPDDKIEFFAGGNKVFDIWNNIPSTQTEEGSTNFCRNVSIQGGSTNTGFANGNGGLSSTSNSNNEYFSLNIRTAIDAGNTNYDTKGILRCVDGSNNNVVTVGAKEIGFFGASTSFYSNSGGDLFSLMKPSNLGSNTLTVWGTTNVTNHILPKRTGLPIGASLLRNIGSSTERFDNIYGINLDCSNITSTSITTDALLPLNPTTSNIGTSLDKFGIIYGYNIGNTSNHFFEIWGDNTYVDQLIPVNLGGTLTSNIGNSSANSFYEIWLNGSNWTSSDRKLKENIVDFENGIEIVKKLRPKSYNLIKSPDNKRFIGFIAQDVYEVLPDIVHRPKNESECYFLSYTELIPVLTEAIQEQQTMIDSLKQKLNLVFAANQIKEDKNITTQKEILNKIPILFQNHPNPFNGFTFIDYFLPENTINAFLKVIDSNGKLVKAFPINKTGFGQVELDCTDLAQGTYYYTLLVNNQAADTKNMIISKTNDY